MKWIKLSHCFLLLLFVGSSLTFAEYHRPQDFLKSISAAPDEGLQIVQHYCIHCHAEKPVISLGAPRIGVQADWDKRIAQGIEPLLKHTDEGINAMPARGGCFECTDQQLFLAILELLPARAKSEFQVPKKIIKNTLR